MATFQQTTETRGSAAKENDLLLPTAFGCSDTETAVRCKTPPRTTYEKNSDGQRLETLECCAINYESDFQRKISRDNYSQNEETLLPSTLQDECTNSQVAFLSDPKTTTCSHPEDLDKGQSGGNETASSQATTSVSTTRTLSNINMLGPLETAFLYSMKHPQGSPKDVKNSSTNTSCRCCSRSINFCKRHPYRLLIIVLTSLALIAVIAFVIFILIAPSVIQREMDATQVQLKSAVVTHPTDEQFDLTFTSNIQRRTGIPVTISEFQGRVLFAPRSESRVPDRAHRYLAPSPVMEDNILMVPHNLLMAYDSTEVEPTRIFTENMLRPYLGNERVTRRLQALSGIATALADNETSTPVLYELGTMVMPAMRLKGRDITTTLNTTVKITNATLFKAFLRELVLLGTTTWTLLGSPSVTVASYSCRNVTFHKKLILQGPKLMSVLEERSREAGTNEEWWMKRHDNEEEPNRETTTNREDALRITYVDLTLSTPTAARLHTTVTFLNTNGTTTVNPLGRLSFIATYEQQPFVTLTTATSIILQPGYNVFELYGTILAVDHETDPRRQEAISRLFSKIVRGETPFLKTQGIGSSIQLFTPAIETIDVVTAMGLFKSSDNGGSGETENAVPSMVKKMEIKSLELVEPVTLPAKGMGMKGDIEVIMGNPFGADTGLLIEKAYLTGTMAVVVREDASSTKPGPIAHRENHTSTGGSVAEADMLVIGELTGTLSGRTLSTVIRDSEGNEKVGSLGALPVSLQQAELKMDLLLDFSGKEASFKTFIKYCLNKEIVTLQLLNVTALVLLKTPMGTLQLERVPLSRDFDIKGFAKMQGITIESINFYTNSPSSDPSGAGNIFVDGLRVDLVARMPPSAQITLYLGTLALDITHEGVHLIYLTAEHCLVSPTQETLLHFTGVATLSQLGAAFGVFKELRSGTLKRLQGTFLPVSSIDERLHDDSPLWLRDALYGFTIEIPMNSKKNARSDVAQNTTRSSRPFFDVILPRIGQALQNSNGLFSDITIRSTSLPTAMSVSESPPRGFGSGALLSHLVEGLQHRRSNIP